MTLSLDDLEELGRKAQLAVDRWQDGERDLKRTAADVGLVVPEVRQALVDRGLTTWEGDDGRWRLADVQAADLGETYLFDVEVLSVEGEMTLPTSVEGTCRRCDGVDEDGVDKNAVESVVLDWRELLFAPPAQQAALLEKKVSLQHANNPDGCQRGRNATAFDVREKAAVDWSILTVADILEEHGFAEARDDIRLEAHLVGVRPPIGGRVRLRAEVQVDPRTRKLVLLAEEYRELEGRPAAPAMDAETVAAFTEVGQLPMDVLRNQVAPDMVGRPLVQESRLLTLLSVNRIPDVDEKEIRGGLVEALIGDTTTDNSESAFDTARHQGFGPVVQAENASRTGITYSITESRRGGFVLTWGVLPRNHGKYVVLDGLERWESYRIGDLRAVLRDQVVEVDRVVHGRRPASVRMTLTLNPKKAMREYPYPCAAILDSGVFEKGPDIARVDTWLSFAKEDVTEEEIAYRRAAGRPVDPDTFRQMVYWAWNLRPRDVRYLPDAKERIKERTVDLLREYGSSTIPIAHQGLRDTICRVAVAYAALSFASPDGGRTLAVTRDHVDRAASFLERVYGDLQLREFKVHHEEGSLVTGGEIFDMVAEVGTLGIQAVHHLHVTTLDGGWLPAKDLAVKLGSPWTAGRVRDTVYSRLTGWDLVETRSGGGARLTPKGVDFFRKVLTVEGLFAEKSPRTGDSLGKKSVNNAVSEGSLFSETGSEEVREPANGGLEETRPGVFRRAREGS